MNSLFENSTSQVEILNFQTFTTEYVAKRYGTSETNIRDHKREHADEIVEGIHFIVETNKFRKTAIKWTLRGIIKLGMFIRSNESKAFRIWAERELEKIILKQAQEYAQTRARNLALADKVNSLEACAIKDAKDRQNQINGYKSQISQHNKEIELLKAKAVIERHERDKRAEYIEFELTRAGNIFKNAVDNFLEHTYLVITNRQKKGN